MKEKDIEEAYKQAFFGCNASNSGIPKLKKITFTNGSEIEGKLPFSIGGKKQKIKSFEFECV